MSRFLAAEGLTLLPKTPTALSLQAQTACSKVCLLSVYSAPTPRRGLYCGEASGLHCSSATLHMQTQAPGDFTPRVQRAGVMGASLSSGRSRALPSLSLVLQLRSLELVGVWGPSALSPPSTPRSSGLKSTRGPQGGPGWPDSPDWGSLETTGLPGRA